ncbi:MAG: hypothetical protein IJA67_01085 [Oscillospiraceae bacterium]|nr:hypothetical protein [Oscillospiraceae bacterium]
MKRILLIAMAALLLCLFACGGGNADVPMTAEFAETNMTVDNFFIAEDSEYISYILFTAQDKVTDVRVYTMDFAEDGFVPADELYSAEEMKKGETLLGGVVFWGDMTTYGMSFTDSSGAERSYEMTISGKDGSLLFTETAE